MVVALLASLIDPRKQHGYLPTHRELAETSRFERTQRRQRSRPRLVGKGCLETDRPPAPPIKPLDKKAWRAANDFQALWLERLKQLVGQHAELRVAT